MSNFTDYLASELYHIEKTNKTSDLTDLDSEDFYKAVILKSLQGRYDDIEDYRNIQKALLRVLELNLENIRQCLKQNNSIPD